MSVQGFFKAIYLEPKGYSTWRKSVYPSPQRIEYIGKGKPLIEGVDYEISDERRRQVNEYLRKEWRKKKDEKESDFLKS